MKHLRKRIVAAAAVLSLAAAGAASGDAPVAYLAMTEGYWQVWVLNPDGGKAEQVTRSAYEKTRCSWFPDGRYLLVNALDGRVFRVDRETGEETRLSLPLEGATDAVLSPDGKQIAFSLSTANSADDNEIWVVGVDGSGLRKLTTMPYLQHDPAWAADGSSIYFLSGDGGQAHDIWRVSVETRAREQLTAGALYHFGVAVAPGGQLAFSGNRSGNYEIYAQRGGGDFEQLTNDPGLDGHPTWSPDGNTIIFHSTRSGTLNLWRLAVDGGEPQQLTDHAQGARSPVWFRPKQVAK